jgi:hypothetical protein
MISVRRPTSPTRRLLALGASITVAAAAVVGCRGSSSGRRDALAAARIRAAQARTVARQAGLGADVQAFLAKAAGASGVTYTVVYDQGGGQSTTVIARAPDRRIDVVGASGPGSTDRVIVRGTDTFVCHLDTRRWTCVSGVVSNPTGPFTPEAITQTIGLLAQLSQTYDFSVSQRPMLGLDASCLAAARQAGKPTDPTVGDQALICIAPSGVILRVEDSGTPVQATSYREMVPSGAFTLPARPTPAVTSTSLTTPGSTP